MVKELPQRFNPDLLARDGTQFDLVLPQSRLTRLSGILAEDRHEVRITARFSRRKDHIVISGQLTTVYALQCQRCLDPMQLNVDENFELVFVEDDQTALELPKELDPVVLDDYGQIHVVDLFEDELMLHVPDIPKHSDASECQVGPTEYGELPSDVEEGKPNPFNALKDFQLH
ncbi:MAG: DUF177 domain-containing protein [Granulosicoccus sp.]|nr:DUF177 domain-containing protein [Granulosicoccus sp.]